MRNTSLEHKIFSISTSQEFETVALEVFRYQATRCAVYARYLDALQVNPMLINHYTQIPCLPISFFKTHTTKNCESPHQVEFTSSGTTSSQLSKHYVAFPDMYRKSFRNTFHQFYGNPQDYIVLALLPSYLEKSNSSLVYMASDIIRETRNSKSGFFLNDFVKLHYTIHENSDKKILLLGVTYALIDFAERFACSHPDIIVMETGGMKGRKKEMTRHEVHSILKKSFSVSSIHSEYGMTELLSQAYSQSDGIFEAPPWMKILVRDIYDPFSYIENKKIGGINIIDLANLYSCSFIETQDLGKLIDKELFTIEGRFDSADLRGCNLMYS